MEGSRSGCGLVLFGEKVTKNPIIGIGSSRKSVYNPNIEEDVSVVLWLEHKSNEGCIMPAGFYLIIEIFTRIFSIWVESAFGVQL